MNTPERTDETVLIAGKRVSKLTTTVLEALVLLKKRATAGDVVKRLRGRFTESTVTTALRQLNSRHNLVMMHATSVVIWGMPHVRVAWEPTEDAIAFFQE